MRNLVRYLENFRLSSRPSCAQLGQKNLIFFVLKQPPSYEKLVVILKEFSLKSPSELRTSYEKLGGKLREFSLKFSSELRTARTKILIFWSLSSPQVMRNLVGYFENFRLILVREAHSS